MSEKEQRNEGSALSESRRSHPHTDFLRVQRALLLRRPFGPPARVLSYMAAALSAAAAAAGARRAAVFASSLAAPLVAGASAPSAAAAAAAAAAAGFRGASPALCSLGSCAPASVLGLSLSRSFFVRVRGVGGGASRDLDRLQGKVEGSGQERALQRRRRFVKPHLERQRNAKEAVFNKAKRERIRLVEEMMLDRRVAGF